MDKSGHIKICDFGLAAIVDSRYRTRAVGTPYYMAPEMLAETQLPHCMASKADVYSFALVMWFIFSGKEPYSHYTEYETFKTAICRQGIRPELHTIPPSVAELLQRCWNAVPNARPPFSEIAQGIFKIAVAKISDEHAKLFWETRITGFQVNWEEFEDHLRNWISRDFNINNDASLHACENLQLSDIQTANEPQLSRALVHFFEFNDPINREMERRWGSPDQPADFTIDMVIECLKTLLDADRENSTVQLSQWEKVIGYFGPVVCTDSDPPRFALLDSISHIAQQDWFHGNISQAEAENRLQNQPNGSFLLRFSSQPGYYTISMLTGASYSHFRFQSPLCSHLFRKIHEIVRDQAPNSCIPTACPGSIFPTFFQQKKPSVYNQLSDEKV